MIMQLCLQHDHDPSKRPFLQEVEDTFMHIDT